jgi:O-antigen ligase
MATQEKKLALQKERVFIGNILFIPIILLLTVIPLIVRLKIIPLSDEVAKIYLTTIGADFFSQYKATFIMIVTGIIILLLFFLFQKQNLKKDKWIFIYTIAASVFILFTLLSTLFSEYKNIALWGVHDKAEGLVIIICYIIIMFYTVYTLQEIKDYRKIIIALGILVVVSTILGVFQYFGKDLMLNTAFGKTLVIPKHYADLSEYLGSQYTEGKVYGTMFHYNYMGSFGAMMVPLFATLTLFVKGKKEKMFLGVMTLASMFLLFGSTSRAGLIGLVGAVVIGIIVFAKKLLERWKLIVPLIAVFVAILIGFNVVTAGKIFERIPTLLNDAVGLFLPSNDEFDYKEHIPVRDIVIKEKATTLVTQADELSIAIEAERVHFLDAQDKEVDYILNGDIYTTEDTRFNFITFKIGQLDAKAETKRLDGLTANINGTDLLAFKLDDVKGVYPINMYSKEPLEIEYPETFGFKGKERLGSARGYIWSRSIPMLKNTLFIGYGPDAYVMAFPQDDLFGKWYAYEMPNMVISKPHNLYLQIGLNEGVIALIAFLVITIGYVVHGLKLYALRHTYTTGDIIGVATMLAIVGYLGSGVFNDSVVSVAPIFWILLGAGIAINYLVSKERRALESITAQ